MQHTLSNRDHLKSKEQEFLVKINAHKGILYKIARSYCADEDDRHDLIQEMIYQLWQSYDGFQGKSQYSTFMYRVCLNCAILFYRKESKSRSQLEQYWKYTNQIDIDQYDSTEDQLKLLYESFQVLDAIEKAILLQYLEGLSHLEISNNLGITEGNVRVKFHRIKEKIKVFVTNKL